MKKYAQTISNLDTLKFKITHGNSLGLYSIMLHINDKCNCKNVTNFDCAVCLDEKVVHILSTASEFKGVSYPQFINKLSTFCPQTIFFAEKTGT